MFLQKSAVNLLSSVLDTPEFFWHAPDNFQTLYTRWDLKVPGTGRTTGTRNKEGNKLALALMGRNSAVVYALVGQGRKLPVPA